MAKNEKEKAEKKARRKKRIVSFFFGRQTIVLTSIAIQIWFIFFIISILGDFSVVVNVILRIAGVIFVFVVMSRELNMSFKLGWIFLILAFPVFGFLIYVFYHTFPSYRAVKRRSVKVEQQIKHLMKDRKELYFENNEIIENGIEKYLWKKSQFPLCKNNDCTYFSSGIDKWERLLEELKNAKKFIFLEYFIISEGEMWDSILEILLQKIEEGVEVKVLYDGTTSIGRLPFGYFARLKRKEKLDSRVFSRVYPFVQPYQNNRDHRKIVVIDGETAFTGGINLSDEYIGKSIRFGKWRDTAVMVKGNGVNTFTYMFLGMWSVAGGYEEIPKEDISKYINDKKNPIGTSVNAHRNEYVVPFSDNPYIKERIGRQIYLDILNNAKEEVVITTPYFVPDDETLSAIKYCAGRGVKTILIMPHIPDKKMIYFLGRTYHKELINAGVKIYEYMPGFVHAKQFFADNSRAVVGTINLDFRSMYLHFECGLYINNNAVIEDIARDTRELINNECEEITVEKCNKYNVICIGIGYITRLISPLL